jgi:hypothetical protein
VIVRIVRDRDHYVVYINGKFYCTADTYREAVQELEQVNNAW